MHFCWHLLQLHQVRRDVNCLNRFILLNYLRWHLFGHLSRNEKANQWCLLGFSWTNVLTSRVLNTINCHEMFFDLICFRCDNHRFTCFNSTIVIYRYTNFWYDWQSLSYQCRQLCANWNKINQQNPRLKLHQISLRKSRHLHHYHLNNRFLLKHSWTIGRCFNAWFSTILLVKNCKK